MGETKVNNNMIQDGAIDSSKLAPNSITSANITDSSLVNADISPSAAISISKLSTPGSATDFLKGDGSFGAVDTSAIAPSCIMLLLTLVSPITYSHYFLTFFVILL